eukprot:TRINITY_DN14282_c0_g1_i1.p2 TRINITY_DN14282_c0_g1~~TRINITY_DN14282_c0_g1_i1.p2  ORF type:complete len:133 (+),score=35.27 TRINITY_DN14282_c0_g1_i1:76-474(+)
MAASGHRFRRRSCCGQLLVALGALLLCSLSLRKQESSRAFVAAPREGHLAAASVTLGLTSLLGSPEAVQAVEEAYLRAKAAKEAAAAEAEMNSSLPFYVAGSGLVLNAIVGVVGFVFVKEWIWKGGGWYNSD